MIRRVIVVGGTGVFGERLVRGIVATTDMAVTIAARDRDRAQALAEALGGAPRVLATRLDAREVTAEALRLLGGFALVDAAGPFQGGDNRLAQASVAAGLHYCDLADARDFVAGFATPALDSAARAAGVVALTGASSTPALSSAALAALTSAWRRIDRVEIAIAPGNRGAPRGLSVVRAILSYAGRRVPLLLDGRWQARPGWGMAVRPALPGLGRRWLSLCETPDLDLPGRDVAVRERAIFRAGLELGVLHLGLLAASLAVRCGLLRSLAPPARAMWTLAALLRGFGTDRGGMLVEAQGIDAAGQFVLARWWLLATGGDGPVIPTLPALALLRALAGGRLAGRSGAGLAAEALDLGTIEAEFAPWRITAQQQRQVLTPLFALALGADAFAALPEPLRDVHGPGWRMLRGEAEIEPAATSLARLLAALAGFPRQAGRVPVRVTMTAEPDGSEVWTRHFGDAPPLRSRLMLGTRLGVLEEAFGPFRFTLALEPTSRGLALRCIGWRLGRLPLPRRLVPHSLAWETLDESGRFRFDVPIVLPLVGRIVRYRGWLVAESERP